MKIPEVILIASQLAFVICHPQHIQLVRRLRLRQVPTESVPLGFSEHNDQGQSLPVGLQMFDLSDSKQNEFVNSSPQVVKVTFAGRARDASFPSLQFVQNNPDNYVRIVPSESQSVGQFISRPSAQQLRIVIEGASRPRNEHIAVINMQQQQRRFVIIPSKQTLRLHEKQEQLVPNHQRIIFQSPAVQHEHSQHRNEGYQYGDPIQENQPISFNHGPFRFQIQGASKEQPISESFPTNADEEKLPLPEHKVKGSSQAPGSNSVLVARLTAPSNDPNSSNILMITKKPCIICCIGNEVEPCKSCCAHTPLLNSQTLKTVLG